MVLVDDLHAGSALTEDLGAAYDAVSARGASAGLIVAGVHDHGRLDPCPTASSPSRSATSNPTRPTMRSPPPSAITSRVDPDLVQAAANRSGGLPLHVQAWGDELWLAAHDPDRPTDLQALAHRVDQRLGHYYSLAWRDLTDSDRAYVAAIANEFGGPVAAGTAAKTPATPAPSPCPRSEQNSSTRASSTSPSSDKSKSPSPASDGGTPARPSRASSRSTKPRREPLPARRTTDWPPMRRRATPGGRSARRLPTGTRRLPSHHRARSTQTGQPRVAGLSFGGGRGIRTLEPVRAYSISSRAHSAGLCDPSLRPSMIARGRPASRTTPRQCLTYLF